MCSQRSCIWCRLQCTVHHTVFKRIRPPTSSGVVSWSGSSGPVYFLTRVCIYFRGLFPCFPYYLVYSLFLFIYVFIDFFLFLLLFELRSFPSCQLFLPTTDSPSVMIYIIIVKSKVQQTLCPMCGGDGPGCLTYYSRLEVFFHFSR